MFQIPPELLWMRSITVLCRHVRGNDRFDVTFSHW
jgi:hypothetical protein